MPPETHIPGHTWHQHVFFGLHFDLHPGEGDRELGAATTYAHIRRELEKVKPDWVMYDCKGVPGYAGYPTRVGIPSPGIVKDALKVWRKVTRDMGISLSVHYCGLWDDVRWQRNPDWAAVKPDGARYGASQFDGWSSHPMAIDGPYADEVLIPQLLEVIDLYDVDGVWVDADAWVAVPDWGAKTRALFVEEMRQRPGSSERADVTVPTRPEDPLWAEYLAFNRRRYAAYLSRYCDALHARKPGFAVCANWAYSARMPDEVTTPVDYLSGDYTWKFAADAIALEAKTFDGRGLPWDLMGWGFTTSGPTSEARWTTRSVEELQMEGALVMSNGGAFWIYDQPLRNGRLVDWHMDEFAEVGHFLHQRQSVFQGTTSASHVALLNSQSHFYAHNNADKPGSLHNADAPMRTLTGALQLLLRNHYHADVLNEDTLLRRLDEYPVVVIAEQTRLPAKLKDALLAWVRRGGKLLLTGAHIVEEWGGVLGVRAAGDRIPELRYVPADQGAVPVSGPWQPVKVAGARALAPLFATPIVETRRGASLPVTSDEMRRGASLPPAATLHKLGRGRIAAIYGPVATMFADYRYPRIRSFAGAVLKALTGTMPVELDAPPYVEMTVRLKQDRTIVHLVNTSSANPLSPAAPMIERVPDIGPLAVRIRRDRRPKSVYALPDDSPLTWRWRDGVVMAVLDRLHIHATVVVE